MEFGHKDACDAVRSPEGLRNRSLPVVRLVSETLKQTVANIQRQIEKRPRAIRMGKPVLGIEGKMQSPEAGLMHPKPVPRGLAGPRNPERGEVRRRESNCPNRRIMRHRPRPPGALVSACLHEGGRGAADG